MLRIWLQVTFAFWTKPLDIGILKLFVIALEFNIKGTYGNITIPPL